MSKIIKHIKHIGISIWLTAKEKTYCANGTRIKYLLFKKQTNALVIVFSAYNEKPLYNYVRSLKGIQATRLYIKDDFGANKKGSYYLGEKGKNNVEETVYELINRQISEMGGISKCDKLIFVGSSKGGYAALNFAAMYNNSVAIVGAPQYLLGTHLIHDNLYYIMDDIIGSRDSKLVLQLDDHIRAKYMAKPETYKQKVYIQYSDIEYTYELHIKPLLLDLESSNIELHAEKLHYSNHSDVHFYFPKYLHDTLLQVLE